MTLTSAWLTKTLTKSYMPYPIFLLRNNYLSTWRRVVRGLARGEVAGLSSGFGNIIGAGLFYI